MLLNEAVRKVRLGMCLEQAEFGNLIGVTKGAVSMYEKGCRKPRLPVIRKILELAKENQIKVSLEDFIN